MVTSRTTFTPSIDKPFIVTLLLALSLPMVAPKHRTICKRAKKTRLVGYEPDVSELKNRCRLAGAEVMGVHMLPIAFPTGITLKAFTRSRTSTEIKTEQFGSGGGPIYFALLEHVLETEGGNNLMADWCRLFQSGGNAFP